MGYQNWLKVGMALQLTDKALAPFCFDKMVSFHNSLKTSIGGNTCSVGCTSDDLKKKRFTCPDNICHNWLAGIIAQSEPSRLYWKNSTVSLWPVHPWQIAQCYMSRGQNPANKDPSMSDLGGILQLIINCKRFHQPELDTIDIDKVKKVIAQFVIEEFLCHKSVLLVSPLAVLIC